MIRITMNEARMKLRKDRRHLYESLDQPKKGEDDGDYVPEILRIGAKYRPST